MKTTSQAPAHDAQNWNRLCCVALSMDAAARVMKWRAIKSMFPGIGLVTLLLITCVTTACLINTRVTVAQNTTTFSAFAPQRLLHAQQSDITKV
jgi:hypothetical protein